MALVLVSPISYHKQSQWRGTETAAWLHLKRAPICRYKIEKNGNSTTDMSFLQKIKNNTNFVVSISFLGGHTAHTVSVWKYIEAWLADLYLLAGRYKASVEFVIFFPPGVIVCAHYVLRASVISRIFLRLEFPSRAPVKSPHAVSFPCQQIPVCLCPSSSHLLNQSL